MSEAHQPLPAAISSNDEPTIPESKQAVSPELPDKTVTAPAVNYNGHIKPQPQPGRRNAIFSTDLGRRAPRGSQQPRFFQSVARSNLEEDVVVAAGYLRKKYPYQYLSILPHQGWHISDLWDDYDIQIEGEKYFTQVLKVIEKHNATQVPRFACEYAEKHPERLALIGGNITGLYDKAHPVSIVDKIFVNEESRDYPPSFLWKVAIVLRTNMLAVRAMTEASKDLAGAPVSSNVDEKDTLVHSAEYASSSAAVPTEAAFSPSTPSKAPAPAVEPAPTTLDPQVASTQHCAGLFARAPAAASPHGRIGPPFGHVSGPGHDKSMGHPMPALPVHRASGPNMTHAGMYAPRIRSGRSASGSHGQTMPASPYVENMPRIPSGYPPRQHAGKLSATQSPRFQSTHMAMDHPMGNVPPNIMPFVYDQDPMGPGGAMVGQRFPIGVMHPGAVTPSAMTGPPIMQVYPRQLSSAHMPPLPAPMGDMTNIHYGGPPGTPMHDMNPRRRRSQHYADGNALYDPYEGSNIAFWNTGYLNGKKYGQGGVHNANGRPRKPSFPGSRLYHGQYTNGRSQTGGPYNSGPKSHMGNDPSVTQDRDYGCFIDWIGPQNEIVNELFVNDLPENVQEVELEGLFQARLGIKPTSICIRCSPQAPQKRHAFVGFPTCAIAKQALVIPNPTIRRNLVSITVPKRFFQKTADVPSRDTVEAGPSAYPRYTSNPNKREGRNRASSSQEASDVTSSTATAKKPSYSPQDARSDLPKRKKKGKQTQQQEQATAGSPEARKVKSKKQLQGPPTKEDPAVPAPTVKTEGSKDDANIEWTGSASASVDPTTSRSSEESARAQASEPTPSEPVNEDMVNPTVTEAIISKSDANSSVAEIVPSEPLPAMLAPSVEPTLEQAMISLPQSGKTTATKTLATASTSAEVHSTASERELKNEASFHSAVQSQSELGDQRSPETDSEDVNHETVSPSLAPPKSTTLSTQEAMNSPTEEAARTMGNQQQEQESKAATVPPTTSKSADVSAATEQEAKSPTSMTLAVGQKKRSGPQQTESMHPMSQKQLKVQARKEREKKKKVDRKDKLAKKGKIVDKTASSQSPPADEPNEKTEETTDNFDALKDKSQPVGEVRSVDTSSTPFAITPDANETSASTKESGPANMSRDLADDTRGKSAKENGKKASTPATKDLASTEDKNEDQGKQTNGTSVTPEIGSVTNKGTKADSGEVFQQTSTEEMTQEDASVTGVLSSKQDDSKQVNSSVPESDPSGAASDRTNTSGKKRKNKKRKKTATRGEGEGETSKPTLAWPNLDFPPKSPNPAWMGPIDMETDLRNYEMIMDEACGGSDVSDFSWSDLPTMEDVLSSDKAELKASLADGITSHPNTDANEEVRIFNALWPRLEKLRPNKATETFVRQSENNTMEEMAEITNDGAILAAKIDAVTQPSKKFKNADDEELKVRAARDIVASSNREKLINRGIVALNAQIDAKQENMTVAGAEGLAGHDCSDTVFLDTQPPNKKKANKQKNNKKKKTAQNGEAFQSGETIVPTATASIPSKAAADPVDPSDPFARQLKHVDTVIGSNQGEAAAPGSVSLRSGAATPTEEPTLMRAMQAYFREAHPERMSKGRKVSQQDLQ